MPRSTWRALVAPLSACGGSLLLAASLALSACEEGPVESTTAGATLEVSTVTTGSPTDPDGYTLTVDGGVGTPVGPNATLSVPKLPEGEHTVELSGIAPNCVLIGRNPRTVALAGEATVRTAFEVGCGTATGSIEVTTATTGESPDPDGYLATLDGSPGRPIASDGTVSFAGVTAGSHRVILTEIAPNCLVAGENPAPVTVGSDAAQVAFEIACAPPTGSILISTTTAGLGPDLDGYAATLDGGAEQAIRSNGTLTLAALPLGDHSVRLSGVAANCAVNGDNPRVVTVTNGGEAPAAFQVSCFPTGTGTVLFASDRTGTSHLFTVRDNGANVVDLTPSTEAFDGDWSPDGSRIVLAMNRHDEARIATMNADGSHLVELAVAGVAPKWSPDGSRVVFESNGTIEVMNADGSNLVSLAAGRRPDWSPDGRLIAFSQLAPRPCIFFVICHEDLYVMSPTGDQLRKLVTDGGCPAWAPDGTRLAYRSMFVGLFVANADGSDRQQLAGAGAGCPVVWSPDGSGIAFAIGTSNGSSQLMVIPSSGGDGVVLAGGPGSEYPESWK